MTETKITFLISYKIHKSNKLPITEKAFYCASTFHTKAHVLNLCLFCGKMSTSSSKVLSEW